MRGYEEQGLITLADVRGTGGTVVAVDEEAIAAAQRRLRAAAHLVEAAAATAVAALETRACRALLTPGTPAVLMLTGHGAKEPMA